MKKLLILSVFIVGFIFAEAQTVIDNFTVGPYIVDYNGQSDIKYRLRDNINLYEFFELQKDTTIITTLVETPIKHACQISGFLGANRYVSKEIGISVVWKQNIGSNLYFNGGLSLAIDHSNFLREQRRNMFELGMPIQIELGKLTHQRASLFGTFGITPTVYSTMSAKTWDGTKYVNADKDLKKSGFLMAPSLEFGGNIPLACTIIRIGVYGTYKINCSSGNYDAYKNCVGRCFLGAKIGFVL